LQCCPVRMCRRRSCADALAVPQTLRFSRTVLRCCRCVRQIKYVIMHTCMHLPPSSCMPRLGAHGFVVAHMAHSLENNWSEPTARSAHTGRRSLTDSAHLFNARLHSWVGLAHTCVHSLAATHLPDTPGPPPSTRPYYSLARSTSTSRVFLLLPKWHCL
jgi:hypothetical protein